MEKKQTNKKFTFILIGLITLGVIYGGYKYIHSLSHETTDDAQIQQNMNPIIPRIAGYIKKVTVTDNQFVKKGDTLFVIDTQDYAVRVKEAEAALLIAQNSLEVSKADIGGAMANVSVSSANSKSTENAIDVAQTKVWRATNDFERYQNLYNNKSITKQQYEQALAAKQEAESNLKVAQEQKNASNYLKNAAVSRSNVSTKQIEVASANIMKAKALYEAAQLNLSYCYVIAPADGQLSSVSIQNGQLVQPGQLLFYLIDNKNPWVIANFKETQLDKMKLGQKVEIKADAYPNAKFEGKVTSFSPATGSRFSLLPPDNASGNFVKTVQRVPVKIELENTNEQQSKLLRSGMNVEVDVYLK